MSSGVLMRVSNFGGGIIGLADELGQVAAVFGYSFEGITIIASFAENNNQELDISDDLVYNY